MAAVIQTVNNENKYENNALIDAFLPVIPCDPVAIGRSCLLCSLPGFCAPEPGPRYSGRNHLNLVVGERKGCLDEVPGLCIFTALRVVCGDLPGYVFFPSCGQIFGLSV